MRRMLIVLTFLTAAFSGQTSFAFAIDETPADASERSTTALKRWAAEAQSGERPMPTLNDPDSAALIRSSFNTDALNYVDSQDIETITNICQNRAEIINIYLMSGLTKSNIQDDQKITEVMNLNTARFENEFSLAMAFNVRCYGLAIPSMQDFIATLPENELTTERRAGLAQVSQGTAGMFMGGLKMAVGQELSEANREMILTALADEAPQLAVALTPAARRDIVSAFDARLPTVSPKGRARLLAVRDAILNAPCNQLCTLS